MTGNQKKQGGPNTRLDDNGKIDEEIKLDANGELRCINVEKGRWHSLECLESDSVLLESKDGAYAPQGEDEMM